MNISTSSLFLSVSEASTDSIIETEDNSPEPQELHKCRDSKEKKEVVPTVHQYNTRLSARLVRTTPQPDQNTQAPLTPRTLSTPVVRLERLTPHNNTTAPTHRRGYPYPPTNHYNYNNCQRQLYNTNQLLAHRYSDNRIVVGDNCYRTSAPALLDQVVFYARPENQSMSIRRSNAHVSANAFPMRAPPAPCSQEATTCSKIYKVVMCVVCIGILGMCLAYINDRYTETYSSFRHVKRELSNIKLQMEGMKDDVQFVVNTKEDTGKKLEQIENLLSDIKKNSANQDQAQCQFKGKPEKGKKKTKMEEDLQHMMEEAIAEYDADKTGRIDFALESAGGAVAGIRNCENFRKESGFLAYILFPILPLCPTNDARLIIQPGVLPGECWAFKGDKCSVIIKLLGKVNITGVSLEHLQKSISPSGDISTAPNKFTIIGLPSAKSTEGTELGTFTYCREKPSLQYFKINHCGESFEYVEMKVLSNHGNPDYTCIYRLRVHGILDKTMEPKSMKIEEKKTKEK